MQPSTRLDNLFEGSGYSSSYIIYCDGVQKLSESFGELLKHVCYIEEFLRPLHLRRSTVSILVEPGLALPAIILGVLKAESSFALLDVCKPFESLLAFQKQLYIKSIIVRDHLLKNLESKLCSCWKKTDEFYVHLKFILLQSTHCRNDSCLNSKKYENFDNESEIAFAIQTSGTTGEPKIVKVPHECIVSNIIDLRQRFSVTTDDIILQSTRITFDPSIIEIFLSLSSGATLVMVADHIRSIPNKLLEIVIENNITILQGTPSLICSFGEKALKEVLLHKDSSLRVLAFGGEACPSLSKLKRWKSYGNCTEIYNLYGLTEVSCWATCYKINFQTGESSSNIPIGEPLLDTKLEIRDENGEIANKGELYVGGLKRFCIVNNEEWPASSHSFMRPTGDFVYKTSEGFIYFEGRHDDIIKYKGHKIALHLVNNMVGTFPEVENSFIHYDFSSAKLYLFIVLGSGRCFESEIECEFVRRLRNSISNLPAVTVIPIPFIPMTKHGKGNSEKLIDLLNVNEEKRVSAKSTVDEESDDIITNMWKSYTSQISIMESDNFILNGGDSLAAVQFVSDAEWHFQVSLPLLIEKILNESFKDVKQYVKLCLEGNIKSMLLCNSMESAEQPSPKKMHGDLRCFKLACKKGYFEHCIHLKDSKSCFVEVSETSQNETLQLHFTFKWDLKKCIDATPCILYLPESNQQLLFIGSHFGIFSCINLVERSEKWQILVPDRIESSACVSACGNYVLFGCYDHHLYCIDIVNGNIFWKYKTGAEVKSSPSVSFNNKAFVGSHDKHVHAIDIESGHLLWKKQVAHGSIFSSPSVIETLSAVCVGTLDGVLALLSMASGDILWKYYSKKPLFSSPLIACNYILVGSTDKCLLCMDFEGKEVFKFFTDGPVFSSAVFLNNHEENLVLFGCHDFHVYCITLNGDLVWKALCDSTIYATPFNFKWNKYFYTCVTSSKGTLYIFELSNGKVVLSWKCPGEIFSSPIILDNILAFGCRDDNVYCFNLTNLSLEQ